MASSPSAPERARAAFRETWRDEPELVAVAPGRVNLIGEHVDYEDGFVFPMAIDRLTAIALRRRSDRRVVLASLEAGPAEREVAFDLDRLDRGRGWGEYAKGVAFSLRAPRGWEGVAASDVPLGAGLSSSASLAMAVARAFAAAGEIPWEPVAMARLARRAEVEWVGVGCGIMDPLAIALGRAGHALLVDCRGLETRAVPLPAGLAIAVLDTGTRRTLAGSAYETRRAECRAAARALLVETLRDASSSLVEERASRLEGPLLSRARHVVAENERVLAAASALEAGDATRFGELLDRSHRSLRDLYEVSSPALDRIVELARSRRDCLGARMTGAGFGGCAIALVREEAALEFARDVTAAYRERTGLPGSAHVCQAEDGARVL